jgi:TonB-dependent receptor
MKTHIHPLRPHAIALAAALCAGTVSAQTTDAEPVQQVVVSGIRASMEKAQDIKRRADQVVDSIVADDIGKLPDANVAEALQRITGVQISRNRGEGDQVQIRGLSQTQTLFNGRSIFTAGKERGVSLQDVPAELLGGADVYKTPTADQIEGGIGGIIDLRMRRPFDFPGMKVAGTIKETYADYAKKKNTEGSILLSNRWKTGMGDVGALLSVAHQKRNYRVDTQELSAPAQLADESGIYAPSGAFYSYQMGQRDRTGVTASLQWRPSNRLDVYLDGSLTRLDTKTDTYGFYASPFWANYSAETNSGAMWPNGAVSSENGTLTKGTMWGDQMGPSSYISDTTTRTHQLALGGKWRGDTWTLRSELGHTQSRYANLYQGVGLGAWTDNPQFAYDMTTAVPSAYPVLPHADDLLNPASYYANNSGYFRQKNNGKETTWRIDGERSLDTPFVTRVRTGARFSDRNATSAELNTIDNIWNAAGTGQIGGALPALADRVAPIPYSDLLHREGGGTFPAQWLAVTDMSWLRDPQALRTALGLNVPGFDAGQTFDYSEKSSALYGMVDFESTLFGKALSGNMGLRYVHTKSMRHWQEANNGTYAPKQSDTTDNDVLPSLNAKLELTDKLQARFSASKVITRPNFDQLTPSLSLNANDKTGYHGNPALAPLSARQFDATLEYYMSQSDYVYGAAFYKKVDGFLQTSALPLQYGGATYTVSTPTNGEDGTIKGLELGYQGFFTSLPGALRGLGLQANFTYVDSRAPGPLQGQQTQLEGLSRQSYNLILMYDWQAISARLAYNHRSDYLAGTINYYPNNGVSISQTPYYMNGYGMVDAYLSYALTKTLKLAVEANNLTRTSRRSHYGVSGLPYGRYVDDRRFGVSLHADF